MSNKKIQKAIEEVRLKYLSQIEELNLKIKEIDDKDKKEKTKEDTANKKQYNKNLKLINIKIEEESKIILKKFFDYEIAFAKVDKAGITNTGSECENELIDVLQEFRKYEAENSIWEKLNITYKYSLDKSGNLRKELL